MATLWPAQDKCRNAFNNLMGHPVAGAKEAVGQRDRPTRDSPAPGIGRVRPDVDVVLLVGDEAHLAQVHGLVATVEADVALPTSKGMNHL